MVLTLETTLYEEIYFLFSFNYFAHKLLYSVRDD